MNDFQFQGKKLVESTTHLPGVLETSPDNQMRDLKKIVHFDAFSGKTRYHLVMELLITHKSAIEYWRLNGKATVGRSHQQRRKPPASPYDMNAISRLHQEGLTYPIHVMVSDPGVRRTSKKVHSSLASQPLPEGCIINVGGGLLVASPEYCFFQMANELPFVKLLELGLELCGSYALPLQGVDYGEGPAAETRLYNRTPLTSKQRLTAFLARLKGLFNQRALTETLKYLADNSASPMETKLFLLLTLPYKSGGYGFEMPELNAKVIPSKTARSISSKRFFRCDLYWKDYDLAVEYDSSLKHLSPKELAADAMKRNSLSAMGVEVITVTSKQIQNTVQFQRTAKQLALNMDRRLRNNERPDFLKLHRELHNLLEL